jgi:hypothetical protein
MKMNLFLFRRRKVSGRTSLKMKFLSKTSWLKDYCRAS